MVDYKFVNFFQLMDAEFSAEFHEPISLYLGFIRLFCFAHRLQVFREVDKNRL